MSIVSKQTAVIVPKNLVHYDPATFAAQKMPNFQEVTAEEALDRIKPVDLGVLPDKKIISIDTETFYTGVPSNRMPANVVRRWIKPSSSGSKYIPNDFPFCISLCDATNSFVVYDTLENQFREFQKLEPLLMDRSVAKTGHNMDFDWHMLANAGVNMRGRFYDSLHVSKLTRADAFTHRLLDIATEIQNLNELSPMYAPTVLKFEHMLDSYKALNRITDYRMFPRELMTQYTCGDVWNGIYALKILYPRLEEMGLTELFNVESAVSLVTYHMERTGAPIDPDYGPILIPELQDEVDEAERKIYDTAGRMFNINSSQQLYGVLCDLGYANLIKFKKPTDAMLAKGITQGNPKLDKFEMERLDNEGVPIISDIVTFRKAEKLLNTFAIKLYEMKDYNSVVHCNINTMEAKTGRFSMSAPSMQNMPRRKDSRVRQAFIAPPGYTLYDFDFKSQESLIMAHYSRAPYLLDIINNGGDIHKAIAAVVYSLDMKDVSKDLRNVAKSIEFAIVYGAGAEKVKSMTADTGVMVNGRKGLTLEEAQLAIRTFKAKVPEVDMFIRTANKVIKERGCIRTVMGRRVYAERGREYACVNYLCQGSAADSTKTRMVDIYKFLRANNFKTRMELQVHDSLLNQVWNEEASFILGYLKWLQTERKLFRVTVQVDVAQCDGNWRSKHDIDVAVVEPPAELLEKMNAYDIWNDGII